MLYYHKALCCLVLFFCIYAQGYTQIQKETFGDQLILGTSLTYIPNFKKDAYRYHEWTWSVNAAVNLSQRWRFGLNKLFLRSHGTRVSTDNFNLFGPFVQYDFIQKGKYRAHGETGFYWGNYCTCGNSDPYKQSGLHYLSFGGGFEYAFYKNFSVELGLLIYKIIDRIEIYNYGYTQYILGINYYLFSEK